MFQNYKLISHFVIWNILFALVCIPTAGKMIDLFGYTVSISILYFPFVYIISDILTEVYGYAVARRVLWYTVISQVFTAFVFQAVVWFPPAESFAGNQSFTDVLGAAPWLVTFGLLAVFSGDITNNYVLAKMKIMTQGRMMPLRLVASTFVGQLVNTAVFYVFGLWGIIPLDAVWASVLFGAVAKTVVEFVMLPVTMRLIAWVKRVEGIDYFDINTDFNPIKL